MEQKEIRAQFANILRNIIGFDPDCINELSPGTTLGNLGLVDEEYPALGEEIRSCFGIKQLPATHWREMTCDQALKLIKGLRK